MYRTRDGRLVPEVAVILAGREAADQLAAHGVTIPPGKLYELGRSVVEHRPAIPPEEMDRILAQLRDQNQAMRQELELAPETLHVRSPEPESPGLDAGLEHGHPQSQVSEQEQDPVRNEKIDPITEYLANDQDDEHDWS